MFTPIQDLKEAVKEGIREAFSEIAVNTGKALLELLIDISYNLALYGGGIAIILYVAGYKQGIRYVGPLIIIYILLNYVFGGMI